MSVDLPEPLAPRIPIDVAALEAERDVGDRRHGLALAADDEALRDAARRASAGTAASTVRRGADESVGPRDIRLSGSGLRSLVSSSWVACVVAWCRGGDGGAGAWNEPRTRFDAPSRRVGLAALDASSEEASKKPGARLAHGSWLASGGSTASG